MKQIKFAGLKVPVLALVICLGTAVAAGGGGLWLSSGQDRSNNRHQASEAKISTGNVDGLAVKWQFNSDGPVSATPAVDGKNLYFPDFAGNLYALDRQTGGVIWQRTVAGYGDGGFPGVPPNDYARTTPAVAGDLLIFGDQGGRAALESGQPFATGSARVMAVNKHTGDLVWSTQVDDHYAAMITSSATVHGDVVYVGVASYEEAYAGFIPSEFYVCCTFRGSVVALEKNSGSILWKTYMVPATGAAPDYSGNAVWGSAPVVDPKRNAVYVGTGNNYSIPDLVAACIEDADGDPEEQQACLTADNFLDAVVALDMDSGEVKWSTTVIPFDTWNTGCLPAALGLPIDPEHCPDPEGPDFDFGQAPMLHTVGTGSDKHDRLTIGQKSGQMWSLDADTGEVVWVTQGGIGGIAGGFIWGSATDGDRIYGAEANSFAAEWNLIGGSSTFSGGWVAMDPTTGEVLWQTANPVPVAPAGGAATVANGVLYGCAQSSFIEEFLGGLPLDNMFAMDAATGEILWSHYSGGACNAGAAVVNGTVYWGFGYPGDAGALQGSGLIAFGLFE